jgi:hypothetical protein
MDSKNSGSPAPHIGRTNQQPIPVKHSAPVYKFSKKSGKNCGLLAEHEERDHTKYDYSDEI